MQELENISSLIISQLKEWGEILTDFETKNKYSIQTPEGRELFLAAEDNSRGFLYRILLRHRRGWTIHIYDKQEQKVLTLEKPFRWFFDELSIFDQNRTLIGKVSWKFNLFFKEYVIKNATHSFIFKISGPLWRPWTFRIYLKNREVGVITKKWSGLGKELFTKADNFVLKFPLDATIEHKILLLGAAFLIDFNYFEKA